MSEILLVLEETTLEEALKEKKANNAGRRSSPVLLASRATVAESLRTLAKHRILSAPLVLGESTLHDDAEADPLDREGNPRDFLGVVDMQDILFSLLAELPKDIPPGDPESSWKTLLSDMQHHFLQRQLFLAAGHGDGDELFQSFFSTSLLEAVVAGGMSGGVGPRSYVAEGDAQSPHSPHVHVSPLHPRVNHRLAILNSKGAIVDVFSQSDLVRFVQKHSSKLGPLALVTLEELGLGLAGNRGLVAVEGSVPAIEAFVRMHAERVSALAVVAPDGSLIGCLSPSDLRGLTEATMSALAMPCEKFLLQAQESHGGEGAAGLRVVQCSPSTTFAEVIDILCANRVHRVFVVDDWKATGKPVGVVTLTDVIRVVVSPESALIGLGRVKK